MALQCYNHPMRPIDIKNALKTPLFTHDMLHALLKGRVANVNEKISRLVSRGDLVRIKRGIYCMGRAYRAIEPDPIAAANMLYALSYVSFDYALSHYGMIPERVSEVTSATVKHPKMFETPLGRFSYVKVPAAAYSLGVDWLYDARNGGRFIATPEKALCDKIRYDRGIGTLSQEGMREYLLYDLRLDLPMQLDTELIRTVAAAYRSRNLRTLAAVIEKRKLHE
jgi:hypothetical protein